MDEEAWRADRVREFVSLRGRCVESWIGVEFALREDVPEAGPHVFHDPAVPCLQLWGMQAVLDGGRFGVATYEHYDSCGLWRPQWEEFDARVQDREWWREPGHGTRWRELSELPVGLVGGVTVYGDRGVVAEVRLTVGGRPLLLMAGELYETWENTLDFHRLDESVLAFTDPSDADRIAWSAPRTGLEVL